MTTKIRLVLGAPFKVISVYVDGIGVMTVNAGAKAIHLVVDSAAFIERADLTTYGLKCYTTQSVIDEIRDKHTRAFVNSLPYQIYINTPAPESIKWVKELAKKTGDYFVLSKTDIEVIALTYQIYTEVTGSEPLIKEIKRPTFTDKLFRVKKPEFGEKYKSPKPIQGDEEFYAEAAMNEIVQNLEETTQESTQAHIGVTLDEEEIEDSDVESENAESSLDNPPENMTSENVDSEDEVDDSEWITMENFDQKLQEGLGLGCLRLDDELESPADAPPVPVACLTKDFAMQNVMMNAGITLLSLSGKVITRARTHVLWCGSCYAHTTKQNSYFCAICGYPNMRRIPVTLHEDGQLEFHFSRKFKKNLRGTKHPIIRPKGGKHADDPIYRADQRLPDRRPPKSKNPNVIPMGATNGLLFDEDDDDFLIDPGAVGVGGGDLASLVFPAHDVNSKAAIKGLRSDGQIVPAPWERWATGGEHGLKPTRYRANRPGRRRTGGKRNKLTK